MPGHLAMHGKLLSDIDDVYDKLVLFGDNEWVQAAVNGTGSKPTLPAAGGDSYHPTAWHTPAELAAHAAALQASTRQIESSFGACCRTIRREAKWGCPAWQGSPAV
ncbi:MAG: hypothetical protein OXE40_17615 [Gammaproteobacteria bacterium]|nr:hypothetical protein [Gammaproteobacteria bacterium]